MKIARKMLFLIVASLVVLLLAASVALGASKPKRIMIVVFDQMRPEYAKQYDMKNVLWLQRQGVNFPNAYVGDMASETVISHNVMVSGMFPKHMGWPDEVMRLVRPLTKADPNNPTATYPAGSIITTGDLGHAQYKQLIEDIGYPKLGDYLHAKFPGSIVANVGQKGYQVESMAASSSDYYVRFGSKRTPPGTEATPVPYVPGLPGSYRGPSGVVPSYIASNDRYKVSVGNSSTDTSLGFIPPADYYGTKTDKPAWLYAEDGRYVPSPYVGHESGDAWVADAAMEIMENEKWSGLFVTLSAMDKIGHMWGAGDVDNQDVYTWDPASMLDWVHMPFIAKNADYQLGRIIAKLKALGQWDDTLLVITADHGGQDSTAGFYGIDAYDGGTLNWYYDPNKTCANTYYGRPGVDSSNKPVPPGTITNNEAVLGVLNDDLNVAYSYQSTAIETWLIDQSEAKKLHTAAQMQELPGVIATYIKDGDEYDFVWSSDSMTRSERAWWINHGKELVDTMACSEAADVVGLLQNRVGYAVYGDHGGAQKQVQRIPMIAYMPGTRPTVNTAGMRTADIMPTVLKAMGIPLAQPVDGKAYTLPIRGVN